MRSSREHRAGSLARPAVTAVLQPHVQADLGAHALALLLSTAAAANSFLSHEVRRCAQFACRLRLHAPIRPIDSKTAAL